MKKSQFILAAPMATVSGSLIVNLLQIAYADLELTKAYCALNKLFVLKPVRFGLNFRCSIPHFAQ